MSEDEGGSEGDFVALFFVSPKETMLSSLFNLLQQPGIVAKIGALKGGVAQGVAALEEVPTMSPRVEGYPELPSRLPETFPRKVAELVSQLSLPSEDVKKFLSEVFRRIEAQILDAFICTYLYAPGTEQRDAFLKEFEHKNAMLERLKSILGDTDIRGFGGESGWSGFGGLSGFGGIGGPGAGGPQPHG